MHLNEKVLTLNQKTIESEWQTPTAWESFDNDSEMYDISLVDGSSLLVSPEHRVYGSFGAVDSTLKTLAGEPAGPIVLAHEEYSLCVDSTQPGQDTVYISNRGLVNGLPVGFVVVGEPFEGYCVSCDLECEDEASCMHPFVVGHVSPQVFEVFDGGAIEQGDLGDLLLHLGEDDGVFAFEFSEGLLEFFGEADVHSPSHHLLNSSRVIGLPAFSHLAFFSSFTNSSLRGSSSTGCQSICSQNLLSSSFSLRVFTYLSNISLLSASSLPASDQFTQGNLSSRCFSPASNETAMQAIYISPLACNSSSLSSFLIMPCLNTSGQFMSGLSSIRFFRLSGMEKVVLTTPSLLRSFNTNTSELYNCICLYDYINKNKRIRYNLTKVTDVYQKLREDPRKDYYFLTEDKKLLKVTKIEKTHYSGRIYDVDVPNDVILVRRSGGTAVWSGNSNTKAMDISKYGNNATFKGSGEPNWTVSGRFGSALQFDGVDDNVSVPDSASLDVAGNITVMAWAKDPASWWNGSWSYRRQVNVSNVADNLTDYQVNVSLNATPLYLAGKLNSTCKDIRFTYYNATTGTETPLNFWTENCTTNSNATLSWFWVNVTYLQNNTNTTVYMYYGNPSAASASNGTNTFYFIDDFEDGDYNGWSQYQASGGCSYTPSIESGSNSVYALYLHACETGSNWVNYSYNQSLSLASGQYRLVSLSYDYVGNSQYWHEGDVEANGSANITWLKTNGWQRKEKNVSLAPGSNIIIRTRTADTHSCALCDCCGFILTDFVLVAKHASPVPVFLMGGEEQPPKAILSKEGAYSLKMSYSGSTLYGGINGNEASAAVSTPESWHHYAMTYNSSRIALYIDGMYAGGAIDEVRVYSRSLSAQEVWLHYQTEFAKYNSTTYRFYSNVTNLSDGTYTYYGWANDSVGNWAYTSTYTAGSPRY